MTSILLSLAESSFLQRAIQLSGDGMRAGHGGPFGCVIVKENKIIGEGYNMVTASNDPTAHAEIVAIRAACAFLQSHQLIDCTIFTSCEPCPMCLGAIYWARPDRVVYANTRKQAAAIAFDDDYIYEELGALIHERKIPFAHVPDAAAAAVFEEWSRLEGRREY